MTTVDAHLLRKLSVESFSDPRSVVKVLRGEPVRSVVRARIVKILEHHGLANDLPPTPTDTPA